jgi:hypothetical protein
MTLSSKREDRGLEPNGRESEAEKAFILAPARLTDSYNAAIRTEGRRIAGTLANMKIASLLILWSSTFLHCGGADRSLVRGQAPRSSHHVASAVFQQPADDSALDGPGGVCAGVSLWDEEDNLDDDLFDTALHSSSWLDFLGRNCLDFQAFSRVRIPGSPAQLIPLRC